MKVQRWAQLVRRREVREGTEKEIGKETGNAIGKKIENAGGVRRGSEAGRGIRIEIIETEIGIIETEIGKGIEIAITGIEIEIIEIATGIGMVVGIVEMRETVAGIEMREKTKTTGIM
jgi:hypothetical protein